MKILRVAILALLLCAGARSARSLEASGPIAITNVTVVDTTGGPAKPNMTVVIRGDRIAAVGATAGTAMPGRARRRREGQVPDPRPLGHARPRVFRRLGARRQGRHAPLFLANGVTGVRDMGSDLESVLAAPRRRGGPQLGPRMVISGPMLDGPKSSITPPSRSGRPRRAAAP